MLGLAHRVRQGGTGRSSPARTCYKDVTGENHMRAAVMFAALLLPACQTPCPGPEAEATSATFRCEDGSDLHVTRGPDTARIVQEGYVTLDLPARIAGPGYRYADNGVELRGLGMEAQWTRPGAAETLCRQAE